MSVPGPIVSQRAAEDIEAWRASFSWRNPGRALPPAEGRCSMPKSAETYFYEFQTSAETDAAMSLLRSKEAFLYLALMATHLADGQIIDGQTLAALVSEDLATLGPAVRLDPDGPEAMFRKWTRKAWVYRNVDPETRIERYQLTAGALQAVQQMRSIQRHTSTATESALAMVMEELRQIAAEANPDPEARKRAIKDEIDVLAAQLESIEGGETPRVDLRELIEKIAALMQLIDRIPADVARYGEQMHANTAALLRQSLSDDAAEFAETLTRMFDGHDVIADSPEGKAFRAFTNLIGMPSQRAQLEADIGEILARVESLPEHLGDALGTFIDRMWLRVQEVESVRRGAFRRMSNFVKGGDAAYYRGMRTRVTEAQASAAEAFRRVPANRDVGFTVPMSGLASQSVGRLRLDEGTAAVPDPVTDSSGEFAIDPAALAGRESIDWEALRTAIHDAMEAHGGFATLPEVLAYVPEPRTGDVIGVWALATRHGEVDDQAHETVWAHTRDGLRELTVPYLVFGEQLPSLRGHPRRHQQSRADLLLMDLAAEGAPYE
jgi:hypothetical protein